MIIAIAGPIASGKGTLADILKKRGFRHLVFSDILKEEIQARGLTQTRESYAEVGHALRTKYGAGVLGLRIREKIVDPQKDWLLDALRNPEEIEPLKDLPDFHVLAITAPLDILIERVKSRQRDLDQNLTEDEIRDDILSELGLLKREGSFEVEACMQRAEYTIENIGTLADLEKEVAKVLKLFGE